jgi:23S rRNA (uracil1939-C5)-methyltransferase
MELRKDQTVQLEITGYSAEGSGVGRYQGIAVFVPLAAAGDRLKVKITRVAKNCAYGKIEKILSPSEDRIPADCPLFTRCGGCVYRHISYEAELRAKRQKVQDAMERIGGLHFTLLNPIAGAEQPDHYRNKAQLPVGIRPDGEISLGFYAAHSHRIVDCGKCLLQPAEFAAAAEAFREWERRTRDSVYDESTGKGRLRHLFLRKAEATGEIMVCVVVNGNGVHDEPSLTALMREKVPGLKSIIINSNREKTNVILGKKCRTVWGQDFITDELCGLKFRISPLSFYQINPRQAERLYAIAGQYAGLTGNETVLDLYCGTGTIGLSMAKNAGRVIGVEAVEQAVEDARKNAAENGIQNAEFLCADAAKAADMLKNRGEKPDIVVLDPPRKGCSAGLIDIVAAMAPERIVYVSCNPATLARDCKLFAPKGYKTMEATPVDMFPRTAHVETVVLMSRRRD